ncbi:MAG TPA: 4-vinyl reductase [Thermoflexia bacterium]|jgi:predicted hydrocarbon binding protein|nr:4-vinyl reductase [Thermoflexia bacterium]
MTSTPRDAAVPEQIVYAFPNKMGRILLLAMEEVMGQNGLTAILNLANLRHLQGRYPPNNFDMDFLFDDVSRLFTALDEMYGPRGGRALALRIGRACFRFGIKDFGPMLGVADLAFRVVPLEMKVRIGLEVSAEVFNRFSDHRVRLGEDEECLTWLVERCGVCWGRETAAPCCHATVGFLQEGLYWVSGGRNFDVEEVACIAAGDEACAVRISRQPVD